MFLDIHRKKPVLNSLFTQFCKVHQFCNFIKKRFRHMGFSMNIAKLLKTPILNKICKRLLLNNAKRNYSSMKTEKQVLNVSQHLRKNTCTGFMLLAQCLLSTLLVLTLTMRELRHWPSIAGMSPQSHCGDEEDGRMGALDCLHDVTKYIYIYMYIYIYNFLN